MTCTASPLLPEYAFRAVQATTSQESNDNDVL
jgi:hypothetical protein